MKSKVALAALTAIVSLPAQEWKIAEAPYPFVFPRDHFNHPDYQTEWWYYTGNLHSSDGRHFGFELTFFRSGLQKSMAQLGVWDPDPLFLAHFAISDLDGSEYYYQERVNRAGPGLAGVSLEEARCWNGNWQAQWLDSQTGRQRLEAVTDRAHLNLMLQPEKPPVINGENGVSIKGPERGESSHYISFTRLHAQGTLRWHGTNFTLDGLAWMDHEFFTPAAHSGINGWDWFSIQLDNHEELMLYRLRRDGSQADRFSSGTFVDAGGRAHHLRASDFTLQAAGTDGAYPANWRISVPQLQLTIEEHTALRNQELVGNGTTPSYWEGSVTYAGTERNQAIAGVGYLEMTGYGSHKVWLSAH